MKKIPIILYLLGDMVFTFLGVLALASFICGFASVEMTETIIWVIFAISFVVYFGGMALALSTIGEWVLRTTNGCKEIKDETILARIMPIFQDVYASAKKMNPGISNKIQLFMNDDEDVNAFAVGRQTICITRGLLTCSNEQIKGVLGHEFGHIAHKDTDLSLCLNVSNFFINILFLAAWGIISVIRLILKILSRVLKLFGRDGKELSGFSSFANTLLYFVQLIFIRWVQSLWNMLGNFVFLLSSRDAEYQADEYSYRLGYKNGLIDFLKTLPDATPEGKVGWKRKIELLSYIGESHPATWKRIERLEQLSFLPA